MQNNNKGPILTALEEVRKNPTLVSEALAKRSARNTRPAAPVEGLERYARTHFDELQDQFGMTRHKYGEYVRFDQADGIITEKNKEIAELRKAIMADEPDPILQHGNFIEMAETLHRACDGGRERAEKAEADNAALTARVKEMEESSKKSGVCITCLTGSPEPYGCSDCLNTGWDGGCPPNSPEDIKMLFAGMISDFSKIKSRAEALETQLAAAEKIAFEHGYVLACCNIVNLHDEPTIAHDALSELGVTRQAVKAMNLSEFDMKALRKIERGCAGSPYAKANRKLRVALEDRP